MLLIAMSEIKNLAADIMAHYEYKTLVVSLHVHLFRRHILLNGSSL